MILLLEKHDMITKEELWDARNMAKAKNRVNPPKRNEIEMKKRLAEKYWFSYETMRNYCSRDTEPHKSTMILFDMFVKDNK